MLSNADPARERRRVQNRMAQRRFRQKRQRALDQQQEQEDNQEHVESQSVVGIIQSPPEHSPGPSPTASIVCMNNYQQDNNPNPFDGLLFHDISLLNFVPDPEEDPSSRIGLTSQSLQDPPTEKVPTSSSVERNQTPSFVEDNLRISGWTSNTDRLEPDGRSITSQWRLQAMPMSLTEDSGPSVLATNRAANSTRWRSPLHMAAQKGQDRIVRILLEHNANCNERDSDGMTPLMHSIEGGLEHVLRLLLSHGACVKETDREGRSVLHLAVLHRREALLRILLNHCSTEEDVTRLIEHYDKSGKTPLHLAVDIGFESGVLILLQLGANPSSRAVVQPDGSGMAI